MKTALIPGRRVPWCDKLLMRTMEMACAPYQAVCAESLRIGVRDEHGEIYRVIGVTGMSSFIEAMCQLHHLGYTDEVVNPNEAEQGFDAVVSSPSEKGLMHHKGCEKEK